MKLHVASDLHLENLTANQAVKLVKQFESIDKTGVDALVLAGDICSFRDDRYRRMAESIASFCGMYKTVVYVAGNHDHWGTTVETATDRCAQLMSKHPNLIVLDCTTTTMCGNVWFGGTLWYQPQSSGYFIDLSKVLSGAGSIYEKNLQFTDALSGAGASIVVSHHFPTSESIAEEWRGYRNNGYFCAYIDEQIEALPVKPKLWIHGHTHNPMDYISGLGFRVYANPYGYENEGLNPEFWNRLEVNV